MAARLYEPADVGVNERSRLRQAVSKFLDKQRL